MARTEFRITLASIVVFVCLTAIALAIHGLLFDEYKVTRYSLAAIVATVACCVMLLQPKAEDGAST